MKNVACHIVSAGRWLDMSGERGTRAKWQEITQLVNNGGSWTDQKKQEPSDWTDKKPGLSRVLEAEGWDGTGIPTIQRDLWFIMTSSNFPTETT